MLRVGVEGLTSTTSKRNLCSTGNNLCGVSALSSRRTGDFYTIYRSHGMQGRTHGQDSRECSSFEASTPGKVVDQIDGKVGAQINEESAEGVKEMYVACELEKTKIGTGMEEGKERVSFATNMTTDNESSTLESVKQDMHMLDVAVSESHAKKVAMLNEQAKAKRSVVKV
jgi:hypothetical protein